MFKNEKNNNQKELNKNKMKNLPKSRTKKNEVRIPVNKPNLISLRSVRTLRNSRKFINKNSNIYKSISSKEEMKKRNSPSKFRNRLNNLQTNKTNYQKYCSENILLSSKDINNKLKDKTIKSNNIKKNYSNFDKVNDIFKKNYLKQTIIIDNEGNNNLNINIEPNRYDYKNILNNKKFNNFNEKNEINNSFSFKDNAELNSLFENSISYNSTIFNQKNEHNDINQDIIDKNEEEKRIKEYNKIFNLLNSNIEQFKKMIFTNNNFPNNNKNENKKIVIKNKINNKLSTIPSRNIRNRQNIIINHSENNNHLNLKKNLSEENLKYSNKNLNLFNINTSNDNIFESNIDNEIKNQNNNNDLKSNYSFLESSIDNDFYQNLINQTFLQNITTNSLDFNLENIPNKENIEINNINKGINLKDNDNKGFVNKKDNNKKKGNGFFFQNLIKLNNANDRKNNYKRYIDYIEKNNCFIF